MHAPILLYQYYPLHIRELNYSLTAFGPHFLLLFAFRSDECNLFSESSAMNDGFYSHE